MQTHCATETFASILATSEWAILVLAVPSTARIKEVGTVIMSGLGVSQHIQVFVLKVFTPWPLLLIVCIWPLLLIVCIIERGNERDPLACSVTGRLISQNPRSRDIQGSCREHRNSLHATLRVRGGGRSNLIVRYSTKAVCGYQLQQHRRPRYCPWQVIGQSKRFYGWKCSWRIASARSLHK